MTTIHFPGGNLLGSVRGGRTFFDESRLIVPIRYDTYISLFCFRKVIYFSYRKVSKYCNAYIASSTHHEGWRY